VSDRDKGPEVGSVGEEAAKLLSAIQDWARESGGDYANAAAGAAAGAASSFQSVNEHIATGGKDCRYCPICQLISAVRETSPEVKQHLATAATSFMHAVAGMMATHVPDQAKKHKPDATVEKIDLTDDGDWEDDTWD
jgi:hypothetical protein